MTDPTTKAEILARIRSASDTFDAAIASLSDAQMLQAGAAGGWSGKDVLAHIAADARWFGGQMEALQTGAPPTADRCYGYDVAPSPAFDMATQDGRNAWQYSRNRDLSLADVRDRAAEFRPLLYAAIEGVDEAEFAKPYTIAGNGHTGWVRPATEAEQGWLLTTWIRGATWHHYEEHAESIRAASLSD